MQPRSSGEVSRSKGAYSIHVSAKSKGQRETQVILVVAACAGESAGADPPVRQAAELLHLRGPGVCAADAAVPARVRRRLVQRVPAPPLRARHALPAHPGGRADGHPLAGQGQRIAFDGVFDPFQKWRGISMSSKGARFAPIALQTGAATCFCMQRARACCRRVGSFCRRRPRSKPSRG